MHETWFGKSYGSSGGFFFLLSCTAEFYGYFVFRETENMSYVQAFGSSNIRFFHYINDLLHKGQQYSAVSPLHTNPLTIIINGQWKVTETFLQSSVWHLHFQFINASLFRTIKEKKRGNILASALRNQNKCIWTLFIISFKSLSNGYYSFSRN